MVAPWKQRKSEVDGRCNLVLQFDCDVSSGRADGESEACVFLADNLTGLEF